MPAFNQRDFFSLRGKKGLWPDRMSRYHIKMQDIPFLLLTNKDACCKSIRLQRKKRIKKQVPLLGFMIQKNFYHFLCPYIEGILVILK